jgi:hypothetical protein
MLALFTACFLLVAYFAYSSILKMEAVHSCEMPLNFYQSTRHHISVLFIATVLQYNSDHMQQVDININIVSEQY